MPGARRGAPSTATPTTRPGPWPRRWDTDGILVDSHNQSTRIAKMDVSRAKELMDSGLIAGGMIPKTMNCIHAVEHGVGSVTVLDGRMEHAILLESISEKSLGTTLEKKR